MKIYRYLICISIICLGVWGSIAQSAVLDATYSTADNLVAFDHPSDWVFYDSDNTGQAYTDADESGVTIEIEMLTGLSFEEVLASATELGEPLESTGILMDERGVVLIEMAVFRGIRDYRYIILTAGGDYATLWYLDKDGIYDDLKPVLEAMVLTIRDGSETSPNNNQSNELVFDTSISPFSKFFTVTIPSSVLEFSASERTPNNLTLTNNWDIFQDEGGISLNTGDVLFVIDYFESATELDLPIDASILDVTNTMISRSGRDESPPVEINAGDYEGYLYVSEQSGIIFTSGMFDVGEGAFAGFTSLATSESESDILLGIAIEVMASLDKGLVFDRLGAMNLELPETYVRELDGFTMNYPEGWLVEESIVGETEFVTVTKGHTFSLAAPPIAGEPAALFAYDTMAGLTGLPSTMLNPETNASRVIQSIIGAPQDTIVQFEIQGLRAAQVVSNQPNFDNWFLTIMLDDQHFIAANIFTAVGEDVDFYGTIAEMMLGAQWGYLPPIETNEETVQPDSTTDNSDNLSIDLAQTFVSESNGLQYNYPSDWIAYDISEELSALINTESAFDALTQQLSPESGQVLITIFTHTTMNELGGGGDEMRVTILNATAFTDGVEELQETEINGQIFYIGEGSSDTSDKIVVLAQAGDNYELLTMLTAKGEMDDFRDTLLAIAMSMTVE